jgi:predicted PurR-regulated permease PerM
MEDNGKLILWGILVVILLIIIGIINPFLLILIIAIFTYLQS